MRVQRQLIVSVIFTFVLLLAGFNVFAQGEDQSGKVVTKSGDDVIYVRETASQQPGQGIKAPGDDTLVFISSEMSFDGKVVKGLPYSAQAITETTRTLSDGNRVMHKSTASIYRDGEGRTRREQELGAVGPWAVSGEPQQTIFINDPVAGVNYILDPRTHIARKTPFPFVKIEPLPPGESTNAVRGGEPWVSVRVESNILTSPASPAGEGAQTQELHIGPDSQKGTTESLGKQTIEGVEAEGTRTTVTIPAGQIGNEQPIHIVWEKWYSPELQVVVMTKHSDPFVGETVYRLTNIVRGEPSRALFEVPADYTIKEIPIHTRVIRRKQSEEK